MTRADYVWLFGSSAFMFVWAVLVLRLLAGPADPERGDDTERALAGGEARRALRDRWVEVRLVLWGFGLNLIWELAQSPLYADHSNGWRQVLWRRLHCSLGDVLILLGAFWATAVLSRSRTWPNTHGTAAAVLFVGLGLVYTTWSEWFNTTVREAWAYAPEMPRVFGLGLSPILQWLALPPLLIWILRRRPNNSDHKGRTP